MLAPAQIDRRDWLNLPIESRHDFEGIQQQPQISHTAATQQSHGGHTADTHQSHSSHTAATQQSHSSHTAVTQQPYSSAAVTHRVLYEGLPDVRQLGLHALASEIYRVDANLWDDVVQREIHKNLDAVLEK